MLGKYQQHCQRLSHLSLFYYAFNAFIINMIMLCVFFLLMLEYVLFNHVKKRKKMPFSALCRELSHWSDWFFPFNSTGSRYIPCLPFWFSWGQEGGGGKHALKCKEALLVAIAGFRFGPLSPSANAGPGHSSLMKRFNIFWCTLRVT